MIFNSIAFAVFLPIVFILYWILPHKFRWLLLLISSYYFYMSWNVKYVVLIFFTTAVSYICALMIEKTQSIKLKRFYMITAITISSSVLFFFKYFNFFSENICTILNTFAIQLQPITLKLLLPVGISFYTFQTLAYVIDVYKGEIKAEKHFGHYATFISFFPQLVAGPIERTKNLLPQIKSEHLFCYDKAVYGLRLMAWGFYKKIIIADNLAVYVDKIYNNLEQYQGFALIIATLCFTFQIYCDFSGYSDIAIGTAKLFDIDLMTNFKSPYFSASIHEFWSRWHISLSTWFKDYVYISLGGNRCGKLRHNINLIVTFLVSGLWHGASWTYIVWGWGNGLAQIIENSFIKKKGTYKVLWWIKVFLIFIFCNIAWVFFRATTLQNAIYVFCNMFNGISNPINYLKKGYIDCGFSKFILLELISIVLPLFIYDYIDLKIDIIASFSKLNTILRWSIYVLLVFTVICLMPIETNQEFIYFQF